MLVRLLKASSVLVLLTAWAAAQPFENCQFRPWKGAERRIIYLTRAGTPPKVDGALDEPWWQ
ncbi:MAG: hypothetical protein FJ279_31675, partial [Planctomycetes bacterium]|nr:hypothetical protein [Planctomycetota bacterium]